MYYQRESSLSHAPSSSDRAGLLKVYLSYAEDEKLPEQLIELYLTKAYKEALERGYLFESEHSKELVKELYSDSDSVQAFLEQCTVKEAGEHISKSMLYREYLDFCEDADRQPLQKQNFNRHLRSKGLIEYRYHSECWKDIQLLDWRNANPFTK